MTESRSRLRILDIFSGSGCIGIAVLKSLPSARVDPDSAKPPRGGCRHSFGGRSTIGVDFAEIEPRFVEQIKFNLKKNGVCDVFRKPIKCHVYRSDMFEHIPPRNRYDYILANPPYIGTDDPVDETVLAYEPHGALFAGKDGLQYIKKLLREAPAFLKPGGKLYFEFAPYQIKALRAIVGKHPIKFHKDQYGRWRYAVMERCA